jgi:DNA polymerase
MTRMAKKSEFPGAEAFLPAKVSLRTLREAAGGCKGCDLWKTGTQTVFGEGPTDATVMFVGEQPGDQEDKAGTPFIGPSGKMLDEVLQKVGIDRSEVYVTNAVKHFKWEPRGKRRIHSKPGAREVAACKPWLKAEVEVVRPLVIVALGATAAQALLGKTFKVTQGRGTPVRDNDWAPCVIATVHPSSLLRVPDPRQREAAVARFEEDLRVVKKELDRIASTRRGRQPQQARRAREAEGGRVWVPDGETAAGRKRQGGHAAR